MKIQNFLLNQAIHFIVPEEPKEFLSPIPTIRAIQDKYGFAQVPQRLDEMDLKKGVHFYRGFFNRKIIDKLSIFENGLLCEGNFNNEILDEFLTEFLQWANTLGYARQFVNLTGVKAYLSQMEITFSANFEKNFSKLSFIGDAMKELLTGYGQVANEFRLRGFRMHYDVAENPALTAPEFILERRSTATFSSNTFFASAPIKTDDHLKMLDRLEAVLS